MGAAGQDPATRPKQAVAHRGASAYAPEHTVAAYRLAIEQGADYVEQDLAITRDGILICLHDDSLERTTNIEQVFPTRSTVDPQRGAHRWLAADFTLEEIKRLDAGSWFDPRFAGERVPTWEEAVELVGTKAGVYPELKTPVLYRERGLDMAASFVASAKKLGLLVSATTNPSRLVVQSFDAQVLQDLSRLIPGVPRTFLLEATDGPRWLTPDGLRSIAMFATGIGPTKSLLDGRADLVRLAHETGLTVTPYTFRSSSPGRFRDVREEMRYFLQDIGADALFTDNPDLFPR